MFVLVLLEDGRKGYVTRNYAKVGQRCDGSRVAAVVGKPIEAKFVPRSSRFNHYV